MPIPRIDYSYGEVYGPVLRVMSLGSTSSSTLSTSTVAAFVYTEPGDLVTINGSIKEFGVTAPGAPGVSAGAFGGGEASCNTLFQPYVLGEGLIYNSVGFQTENSSTTVLSYRVF